MENNINSTFWKNRKCLVTGGAGFGGSHLCEQLLKRSATVYILDRVCPGNSYLVLNGLLPRLEFITGDIRELENLKLLLERYQIDTVFHLAAQPIVPTSNVVPYETFSINVMGTYSVLEAVRTTSYTNILVFASSGAYYGTTTTSELINEENSPGVATNMYSPSKVAGDIAVRCYARAFNLNTAVCRFINTYGPGSTNFSTIVPTAIANLLDDLPYDFGTRDDGTSTFDYLHIRDMVNGYITVAESMDRAKGEAFNFSGGNPISVRDLVKLISRLYDGRDREPLFHGKKRDVPIRKCLDSSKARRILGWQPAISLEEGLKETIEWYKRFWPSIRHREGYAQLFNSGLQPVKT